MTSNAQKQASAKYDRSNTKSVLLKLNIRTDADILLKLQETQNKQGYLKELIRDDIRGKEEVLSVDTIRYLSQPVARKFGLKKVYLFGSYARNEATESSDVDLLIEGGGDRTLSEYLSLQKAFEDAIGKKIDLVEGSATKPETRSGKRFMRHVERDRILLYG